MAHNTGSYTLIVKQAGKAPRVKRPILPPFKVWIPERTSPGQTTMSTTASDTVAKNTKVIVKAFRGEPLCRFVGSRFGRALEICWAGAVTYFAETDVFEFDPALLSELESAWRCGDLDRLAHLWSVAARFEAGS